MGKFRENKMTQLRNVEMQRLTNVCLVTFVLQKNGENSEKK